MGLGLLRNPIHGRMINIKRKIAPISLFLVFSLNTLASGSIAFNELYHKSCNKSCTLKPEIGEPFHIEYHIEKRGGEENGVGYFAVITLNGKTFKPLRTVYEPIGGRLLFHQEMFFDDHRFQIFSLVSSQHASTEYLFYFIRDGNTFHLLGDKAFPGMAYGCEPTNKHPKECFYAEVGYGRGEYVRQNYKLDGHRFAEID